MKYQSFKYVGALFIALSQLCHSEMNPTNSLWELSLSDLLQVKTTRIATGTLTPIDKAASTVTVITSEDIETMGATDIDEVLETVPGLHVAVSDQGFTPKYNFRGITSSYNSQALMLINGTAITSLFVGNRSNVWAGMPIKSISRIEVIRGPGSALYGADAFSGVINIITKNREEISQTQFGTRLGSFNHKATWLQTSSSFGETDIAFSLEAEKTDGWKETITQDAQTIIDNDPNNPTEAASLAPGSVNAMRDTIESRLEVSNGHYRLRMGYQGRSNIGTGPGIAQALDDHGRFASNRFNIDISHSNKQIADFWGLESKVSYYHATQEVEKNVHLFPKGAFYGSYPDAFVGNPENKEHNVRLDISSLYRGLDNHLIRLGMGYYWGEIYEVTEFKNFNPDFSPKGGLEDVSDTNEAYLPEKGRSNYHSFAQDEWQINNTLQLITGLRYDHYSDFGNTTNPRLALIWAASPEITQKILYGRAFRAPSIAELHVISNPVILGNSKLKPETINTFELALSYHPQGRYSINSNLYYYDIDDYIIFVAEGATATAQNAGKRAGYGTELELSLPINDSLRLYMNYAYQYSADKTTHEPIGEAPNHQAHIRSDWRLHANWNLNSQASWVGEQKRTFNDNRSSLNDYTKIDVTLKYQGITSPISFKFAIKNVMDAKISEVSQGPSVLPAAAIPNDLPLAGRSMYAELQLDY